ncbi:unnamed protein product [Ectocarpus sp. CCAP 1310/34]|nr:unnamed protein product [Ectocarpus sp. CCAP 1310/34]
MMNTLACSLAVLASASAGVSVLLFV